MGVGTFLDQGFVVVDGIEGVGRAVVLQAAQRGASILFSGPPRSEGQATQVLDALSPAAAAERVSFEAADLSLPSEVDRLFDVAYERLPGLHILVVNLVQQETLFRGMPLIETSLADWNQGLSLYLRRPFLVTQRAVEEFLIGGESGRIVYVVSAPSGDEGSHVSVAAARSALGSFVRSVTKEYGRRGIACNAVVVQQTPGTQEVPEQPDAVAQTVLFLASSEASYVNGEVLEAQG
jgi:NAD(P)-dependent dehydrogenase (short-subunit alcohol dehydrogenase family)